MPSAVFARLGALALAAALLLAGCVSSSSPIDPDDAASQVEQYNQRSRASSQEEDASDDGLKPYDEVVPDDADTDDGLFTTHRVDDKLYFEIPDSLLGRDVLLVSRFTQVPSDDLGGFLTAGAKVGERVVRWERVHDRVVLRPVSYAAVASDTSAHIAQSVRLNAFQPILMAFDIEALARDSAGVVIETTDLFTDDVPALNGFSNSFRRQLDIRRLDGKRTFIDSVKAFPENVEVRHTLTFRATGTPTANATGALTVQLNQSMILLPTEPMMPRLADPRVGYFTVDQIDYASKAQKAAERELIRRWRLEPADPDAYRRGELVAPKDPIVYYIDPATPARWRPYVMAGVNDWADAFEAAGFKDAIRAAMPPTDDPDWSPEDARFSMVRYAASTTRNAYGPSVSDPRSGEIIESDIFFFHNHLRSYRNRLLIETGAANPDARSLDLPDDLIGEALRQVIAHEVGHALGLPHNMMASASYPVDSLRSPTFTSEYGVAASIMDYARQNYVAQPGDGVTRFIRKIGPYDRYALEWGYRVYPDAATPEAERPLLNALVEAHAGDPMFRYGRQRAGYKVDPRAQTEDLGADPVEASRLGVANLKRVAPNLADWATKDGESYDDLEQIYGEMLGMWFRYMRHVANVVAGVQEDLSVAGQERPVYTPVARDAQERALAFLAEEALQPPTWMLQERVLRKIEHAGSVDRVRRAQVGLLESLLDAERLQRLVELEATAPAGIEAYPMADYMDDVRAAVWGELDAARPSVGVHRRHLQRGYLDALATLMTEDIEVDPGRPSFFWTTPVAVGQSDIRPVVRAQLRAVQRAAERRIPRAADAATRYHLDDVAARIERLLDGDA